MVMSVASESISARFFAASPLKTTGHLVALQPVDQAARGMAGAEMRGEAIQEPLAVFQQVQLRVLRQVGDVELGQRVEAHGTLVAQSISTLPIQTAALGNRV